MYLSDCKHSINKELTKLVFFFDKVKFYKINNYQHRSIVENPSKSRH